MIQEQIVNLDQPPRKRWAFLIHYRTEVRQFEQQMMTELVGTSNWLSWVESSLSSASKYLLASHTLFQQDLIAMSDILGIHLGRLLLMQLFFEANLACTSFCWLDDQQQLRHFRTLDWELPILKKLILNLVVYRRGQLIYRSIGWAGYLGSLTVMRPGQYTLVVNHRSEPAAPTTSWFSIFGNHSDKVPVDQKSFWTSFKNLIGYHWPIGYVVRFAVENYASLEEARRYLQRSLLVSPCYFSLVGVDRAYVLTRTVNNLAEPNQIMVRPVNKTNFQTPLCLIQTNIDHQQRAQGANLLWSLERISYLETIQDQLIEQPYSTELVWSLMEHHPVLNPETLFGCLMSPTDDGWQIRLVTEDRHWFKEKSIDYQLRTTTESSDEHVINAVTASVTIDTNVADKSIEDKTTKKEELSKEFQGKGHLTKDLVESRDTWVENDHQESRFRDNILSKFQIKDSIQLMDQVIHHPLDNQK